MFRTLAAIDGASEEVIIESPRHLSEPLNSMRIHAAKLDEVIPAAHAWLA